MPPPSRTKINDGVLSDGTKKGRGRPPGSKSGSKTNVSSLNTNIDLSGDEEEEQWKCKDCNKIFTDSNAKMLECERCRSHHCTKCLGKTDEEYEVLQDSDSMWFCISCREVIQKSIVTDLKIEERCKAIMEEYESRISTLEESINKKCDEERVREIINEATTQESHKDCEKETKPPTLPPQANLTNIMSEINERKSREQNIVLYGIPESNSTSREDRIKHDTEQVNIILDRCNAKGGEADIAKVTRLGKYNTEKAQEQQKHRPLLVSLDKMDTKKALFKNIRKLGEHEEHKMVKISNDLTKTEREQEKKLWEEAKQKRDQNTSGEFTYKVRGPPWARKVVKLKKENTED